MGGRKMQVIFLFFLIFLFLASPFCLAKITYTTDQINTLQNTYKLSSDQITNLQNRDVSYNAFKQSADKYGATYAYNDLANPDIPADTGADLGYGVQNTGDNLGLKIIFAPIIAALFLIAFFLKSFVGLAGSLLDLTLRPELYTNITNNDMVKVGWTVVRDVCNLFFLLALLFIAFCTILKIEKYHAKKTLLMLVIMALLINFSKPIAVFIFDGSQLLMNFFLSRMPQGNQSASTMYNSANEIAKIIYENIPEYSKSDKHVGLAVQYLFAIVFLFMLLVAYLVIAIFMIIRIVAIMILVIVSPFAFFASVIPDFNKMSSSWWDALFKYAYFGPAAAFFLYLATGFSQHLPKITGTLQGIPNGAPGMGELLVKIVSYLTVLVFLYASIIMANKFSLQFSQAVIGTADRALKWGIGMASGYRAGRWFAKKAVPYVTKAGLRKFDRDVLVPLGISPRAIKEGWQKSAQEVEERVMKPAAARWEDHWNKFWGRKKAPDYKKNVQFESDIERDTKEQRNVSVQDEALIGVIEQFKDDNSSEAKSKTVSALRLLFENNDQNEFMKQYILKNAEFFNAEIQKIVRERMTGEGKTEEEIAEELERVKIDPTDPEAAHNPDALRAALEYTLRRTNMNDDEIGRQLFQLGNIALPRGNTGNYGMGNYDAKTGRYRISDSETNRAFALAKARNIDVQEKMKKLHWNALFTEVPLYDSAGNIIGKDVGNIHETGLMMLAQMKQAEIKQLNRSRPDLIENCYKALGRDQEYGELGQFDKAAQELEKRAREAQTRGEEEMHKELIQSAANVREFAKGIRAQYEAAKTEESGKEKPQPSQPRRQPRPTAQRRGPAEGRR
ncbi:MAG: hypothetical protein A3J76_02520 [Candidatus Moranbacteria bacterium RBG_13_45_13]|nr:MAG: hypothetical protein A3J76_02520 [Candidatus Moranbacteria bacterium RBG_13_45_13]